MKLFIREPGHDEPATIEVVADATIGRDETNDVVVDDASVSARHGRFTVAAGVLVYVDLGSSNGSALKTADGVTQALSARVPTPLSPGDTLLLGASDRPVAITIADTADPAASGPAPAARQATVLASAPLVNLVTGREADLIALAGRALAASDGEELAAATLTFLHAALPGADGHAVTLHGAALAASAGNRAPASVERLARGVERPQLLLVDGDNALPTTESIAATEMVAAMVAPLRGPTGVHHGALIAWSKRGPGPLSGGALETLSVAAAIVALSTQSLVTRASDAQARRRLERDNARLRGEEAAPSDPIGEAPAFLAAVELARQLASSNVPLLITGETGTGKEVLARAVHRWSGRANRPFVAFNCAAVPESLIESELFGHARGAFTGAHAERRGYFEEADGGILFLDEIGEMPAVMQAKLLRVLQDGEVRRVGGNKTTKVDVRVVSATHRDLAAMVAEGSFRADLMYRLNAVTIALPPLRERGDDITLLAHYLLGRCCDRAQKKVPGFSPDALWALSMARFEGNVRQLENEVMRAVALTPAGEPIRASALSPALVPAAAIPPASTNQTVTLRQAVTRAERQAIEAALESTAGNISQAAKLLGLTRPGLYKVMDRLGLR